jgi:hypothetical protein
MKSIYIRESQSHIINAIGYGKQTEYKLRRNADGFAPTLAPGDGIDPPITSISRSACSTSFLLSTPPVMATIPENVQEHNLYVDYVIRYSFGDVGE